MRRRGGLLRGVGRCVGGIRVLRESRLGRFGFWVLWRLYGGDVVLIWGGWCLGWVIGELKWGVVPQSVSSGFHILDPIFYSPPCDEKLDC